MGYDTTFDGSIAISPPLNPQEVDYLRRFADTRHMDRARGPYFAPGDFGHGDESDVREQNAPDAGSGQPSLWCNFVPAEDGTALIWNEVEKTYEASEWVTYLIDTFLKPGAALQRELASIPWPNRYYDPAFAHFTFNHVLNGSLNAEGEDRGDVWRLVVTNNAVTREADDDEPGEECWPPVVCLCGSGRFVEAFREATVRETLAGRIVLPLGVRLNADSDLLDGLSRDELVQLRARLDILHRHKILMADEVLVLDQDRYVGESTRLEIEFAEAHGKRVRYLSDERAAVGAEG